MWMILKLNRTRDYDTEIYVNLGFVKSFYDYNGGCCLDYGYDYLIEVKETASEIYQLLAKLNPQL